MTPFPTAKIFSAQPPIRVLADLFGQPNSLGRGCRTFFPVLLLAVLLNAGCGGGGGSADGAVAEDTDGDVLGNNLPTITTTLSASSPTIIVAGEFFAFAPIAEDPDGDPLTFSVENLPGWATFEITTGDFIGTPIISDIGIYSDIVVSVSDRELGASPAAFYAGGC